MTIYFGKNGENSLRIIALIPVYNEESTLVSVLKEISPLVDFALVVDDGSSDRSLALAREWASHQNHVEVLHLPQNRGMSSALREGFVRLAERLQSQELDGEDLLLTLDADGQHDPREIDELCDYMRTRNLDVALTRRDFSLYPFYKRLGNHLMTLWGSLWAGFRYRDVESGFRGLRLKVLPRLLDYYTGYRYSCAQEIAVLTARLGFRIDNNFLTVIQRYRSQTGIRDVIINAMFAAWACARWLFQRKVEPRPALARAVVPSEPL